MPQNDDFFLPRHTDVYEPCANDKNITSGNVVLPFGAALSVLCYLYLMWMYFVLQSPVFRRHPTTLAVYKCMIELIFIQQYLWVPSINNQKFFDDDHDSAPYKCSSSVYAAYLAFVTQFSLVGSELCFFIISYDLRLAYTNPFSSFKQNRSFFFTLVVGISLFTSFILIFMGPRVYGMSDLGLVWIQERREQGSPNYPKAVLYYFITIMVFIYSIWANFQFSLDSGKGFSKTVSNRLSIMKRSKKFTIGYVGYESLVFLMEFISYASSNSSTVVNNAPAYLLAFRGVWGLAVILYSNYSELTWELLNPFHLSLQQDRMKEDNAMERLLLQPHLNTALRAEILYFTTQGIMFAARDYHRRAVARLNRGSATGDDPLSLGSLRNGTKNAEAEEGEEDAEFSINGAPDGIDRSRERTSERSKSTAFPSRYSLSSIYNNRKSLPNHQGTGSGAPTSPHSPAFSTDEQDFDMNGMDMFSRKSVAIFERLNKEQSAAVNKEMEEAFLDEAESLGLVKKNKTTADIRQSLSAAASRTYNPFHEQQMAALKKRNPLQRSTSMDAGVEMRPAGPTVMGTAARRPGGGDVEDQMQYEEEQGEGDENESVRDSEAVDVEFGMDQNKVENKNSSAKNSSGLPLWRRIETPVAVDSTRTLSMNSDRAATHSTDSIQATVDDSRHSSASRSSIISKVVMNAIAHASDVAKNFFSSRQFKEFRFKDFCPKLFGKVRELSGVNNEEYAKYFEKTCKEKFSEGRSGAFMFFSSNEQFIVKTTTKSESLALHAIMPQYVAHLKNNPNSLVCRFLGAHCITMYGNELYFVVMLNVFPTFPLSERYDLKGSWVNRHGFEISRKSKRERMRREPSDSSPLYQDNDLQHKISLETDVTFSLASQIRRDVLFLREMQLMDYSLLIGVRRERFKVMGHNDSSIDGVDRASHVSVLRDTELSVAPSFDAHGSMIHRPTSNSVISRTVSGLAHSVEPVNQDAFKRDAHGGMRARLVEGPGTYYIGIIDVLQEWNWNKKIERFLKMYVKRYDGDGISAIEPASYSERFWRGAVLDTFDGLEYDTEEILQWKGDESGGVAPRGSELDP